MSAGKGQLNPPFAAALGLASMRPRFVSGERICNQMGISHDQFASMRPRFVSGERPARPQQSAEPVGASMRPRFVSGERLAGPVDITDIDARFNEAPLCQRGKGAVRCRPPHHGSRFNEAPLCQRGKAVKLVIRQDGSGASMRPRFVSGERLAGQRGCHCRDQRFNEAPLCQRGKGRAGLCQ